MRFAEGYFALRPYGSAVRPRAVREQAMAIAPPRSVDAPDNAL
jgi:hypothetical protein